MSCLNTYTFKITIRYFLCVGKRKQLFLVSNCSCRKSILLLGYGLITQNLIESLNRETRNQRVNKFIVIEYILLIKYSINFNDTFEPKTLTTQSYRVRGLLQVSMVHIYIGKHSVSCIYQGLGLIYTINLFTRKK